MHDVGIVHGAMFTAGGSRKDVLAAGIDITPKNALLGFSGFDALPMEKDIWLPRSELGNSRRFLQKFVGQHRAQQGIAPSRPTFLTKAG